MKNWQKAIVAAALLVIAGLYAWQKWPIAIYDTTFDTSATLPYLVQADTASQEFVCYHDGLCGIQVRLSKLGHTEFGQYTWKLETEDGKLVAEGDLDPNDADYRGDLRVSFDEQKASAGKTYRFTVTAQSVESADKSITLYLSTPEKGAGTVTYNGETQEGSLMLQGIEHYFSVETFLMAFCLLLYVAFFIRFMSRLFT